ncbi:NFACT family protein [Candidatus Bathyarchaeota archaeon]|nr:NFACT family protein [Candidatus Bathyarchaeota archaeon]
MGKKKFTSFDVAAVVYELQECIIDSRVNSVYQLDGKTLLLKLHKPDKPELRLVLEAGRRLHLTSYVLEKPLTPPAFCMALRKYLRNSRLTSLEQYEFERIVILSFKTSAGVVRLVLELFGEGNVILVGEDGRILQALSYKRMRDRNILCGEAFVFPPSSGKNPSKIGKEEFRSILKGVGDVEVVRAVARFLGVGGVYAEEALLRAGVDKTKHCDALGEKEIDSISDGLRALLSRVQTRDLEPTIVLDESDSLLDVVPFKLKRYEGFRLQSYEGFNEALDEFYARVTAVEKALAGVEVGRLQREAERLKRIIADQEKVMAEAEAKADIDKRIGDTIYAYSGDFQALLDKFSVGKQMGKNWNAVVSEVLSEKKAGLKPSVFFESLDSKGLTANVCVEGLIFGLELQRSLFENAASFYERGKKARQKLEGARAALEDSRRKLTEVEKKMHKAEELEQVKPAEAMQELAKHKVKHKEWFEKFRWFVSSDGFLVVAGKDATSNEVLVKKYTEDKDVVFHADIVGAPFVVVKTEGKKPSEQCLREAGEFAAAFSRGWREGFGSVDVYWVRPEQLSKGGPSGESVAHGAFVVRGERNWMRGTPLRIAVGVAISDRESRARISGGPVEAVRAKLNAYVVIVPGDVEGKELFNRVLTSLGRKLPRELRETVLNVSIEEIREFIPYGKGRILEG